MPRDPRSQDRACAVFSVVHHPSHIPQGSPLALLRLCIAYPLAMLGHPYAHRLIERVTDTWEEGPPVLAQSSASTACVLAAAEGRLDDARAAASRAAALSAITRPPALRSRDLFRLLALGAGDDRMREELRDIARRTALPIAVSFVAQMDAWEDPIRPADRHEALRLTIGWHAQSAAERRSLGGGSATHDGGRDSAPAARFEELTRREREIALLAEDGLSNREIAEPLFLSVRTVESHIFQARGKVHARTRRELGAAVARWSARRQRPR